MNIIDQIFDHADRSAVALVHGDDSLTFGALRDLVDEAAAELRATGRFDAVPGRALRVGFSAPNGFGHVLYSLAVLRCGGCLVPVAGELTPRERDQLVNVTGVDVLVTAEGQDWHREAAGTKTVVAGGIRAKILPGVRMRKEPPDFDEAALAVLNPALIRFSSGTTGRSKGVVLSHEALLERVVACNSRLRITPHDRVIWILPMAHHFAVSIVLYLLHGARTVLLDSHLAEGVARGVEQFGGTVMYGSPFHYALLAEYPEGRPFDSLRLAVSTAAALPRRIAELFRERYGIPLTQALGIIELGLPLVNDEGAAERPLAVGLPQAGFEVQVAAEDGGNATAGEIGEILVRGPGMFDAYLSPWQLRDEVTDREGWFHTGDLGHTDGTGAVTLAGRLKAVINVGGMKVFAEEIEGVLCEHPAIAEARVRAAPHPLVGNVPVAEAVLRRPGAPPRKAEVISFCRERLSHYKVPMKVRWVEALPRTASGKIRR